MARSMGRRSNTASYDPGRMDNDSGYQVGLRETFEQRFGVGYDGIQGPREGWVPGTDCYNYPQYGQQYAGGLAGNYMPQANMMQAPQHEMYPAYMMNMMNNPMVQTMQMMQQFNNMLCGQSRSTQYGSMNGIPEGNFIAPNYMHGDIGYHRSQPWYPPSEVSHTEARTEQWARASAGHMVDVSTDQQFGEAVRPHSHRRHRKFRSRFPDQMLDQTHDDPQEYYNDGHSGDQGSVPQRHISTVMVEREVPANFVSKIGGNYKIDPDKIRSGEDTRTTVYWTSIPNKYNRTSLHRVLSALYPNRIDYLYIVMDPSNGCNVGFAFLNFKSPLDVLTFYKDFHRKGWAQLRSEKICEVGYGCNQGIEALKAVHNKQRRPRSHDHLPLFLDETTGELAPLHSHVNAKAGGLRASDMQDMG